MVTDCVRNGDTLTVTTALELAAKPQTLAEGDARTVSLVMNPDTSGEKTISLTVAKGNMGGCSVSSRRAIYF